MMYKKSYLSACDGQQEEMYFKHLSKLINNFPHKVVNFRTFIGNSNDLKKRYEEYDKVDVFDYDLNDIEFERNIKNCDSLNKKEKNQNIYHAYSSLNFDLWILLHKKDFNCSINHNDGYIREIRKIYNLKSTEDIKNKKVIEKILNQITLEDVKKAIERAEKIRNSKLEQDARKIGDTKVYPNPDFSINEFIKIVLKDSGDL